MIQVGLAGPSITTNAFNDFASSDNFTVRIPTTAAQHSQFKPWQFEALHCCVLAAELKQSWPLKCIKDG